VETSLLTATGDELRERVRRVISSQKRPTVTVLSSLLAAHDELGFLPDESIEEVADFTDTTINEVWGVATFYTNFRFTPPGQHVVEVCWGPTCHLAGASQILQGIQGDLGLSGEGETEDNAVTLKYNTCLGACTQAPVMSMDHRLTGRLTAESARRLVGELVRGSS
jgi:NADH-quinone oxidoreductase subunit E